MKKCIYCDDLVEQDIWKEEGGMCVECSHKYYDGEIDPMTPITPDNSTEYSFGDYAAISGDFGGSGDRYFAFGFGLVDVWSGSGLDYLWADNIGEAIAKIRKHYPTEKLVIRSAVLGEWDCDSFTLSGHIPHNK